MTTSTTPTGPRFPYAADAAATHDALVGCENMLQSLARRLSHNRLGDADRDDLMQRCRIFLWTYSLPRYDAHRRPRPKVSTFIFRCASNFMKTELRAISRRKVSIKTLPIDTGENTLNTVTATDATSDGRIESIAADVLNFPERYMTGAQADVFRAVMNAQPETTQRQIAQGLGYADAGSLSMILRRIRERIEKIDVETWTPPAAPTKQAA